MIHIELYVNGVELPERLFTTVFGFTSVEQKAGWRLLRHPDQHDLMLFDAAILKNGVAHWPEIKDATAGIGVEIVLLVEDASAKRKSVMALGLTCSEVAATAWGTREFVFRLKEGYLFRIKQPL